MFPAWSADLVGVVGELDAAGLAAAADLHLGLDDDGVAGGLGLGDRLVDRSATPPGTDRDAEAGEVLLALVLEEIHDRGSFVGGRRQTIATVRPSGSEGHGTLRACRPLPALPTAALAVAVAPSCPCSAGSACCWLDLRRRRGGSRRGSRGAAPSRRPRLAPTTFPVGDVEAVADEIDETGPVLFAGPEHDARGERTLVLDHTGDDPDPRLAGVLGVPGRRRSRRAR